MAGLTNKQEFFCREYLKDLNATAAASRAGYKDGNIGRQLITKNNVSERIAQLKEERAERTEVTADRVVKELARLGFSDLRNVASWDAEKGLAWKSSDELDDNAAAAIRDITHTREVRREKSGAEVETTNTALKLHDKKGALELLGRHLGIFTDNLNISNDRPFEIRVRGLTNAESERNDSR